LGSGLGVLALYRGLALGQIAVVAPVAGILTALIPAVLGLALGDRPGALALAGIALALPAVALVSWQQQGGGTGRRGVLEGVAAGACFALLFIGLDRAGTASGTWPLVPGQLIALVLIATAVVSTHSGRPTLGRIAPLAVATGGLGGVGNILFLNATGHGELAVVAVITSLYPAITVVLARLFLSERWTGLQMIGLGVATLAVALISL
jgi:drug/metabolite transporter (DMT)-like permease